jgi:hypothetical protein
MEGVLHDAMIIRMTKKEQMYLKVPLKTPEELCTVIDINIEDNYIFNEKTNILAIDCIKNSCYPVEINREEIDVLNSYKSISRGIILYNKIKNL